MTSRWSPTSPKINNRPDIQNAIDRIWRAINQLNGAELGQGSAGGTAAPNSLDSNITNQINTPGTGSGVPGSGGGGTAVDASLLIDRAGTRSPTENHDWNNKKLINVSELEVNTSIKINGMDVALLQDAEDAQMLAWMAL